MFNEITFMLDPFFHKPLIMWGGILVGILFFTTAISGYVMVNGIMKIPFKWHKFLAYSAVGIGLFHAIIGILSFF